MFRRADKDALVTLKDEETKSYIRSKGVDAGMVRDAIVAYLERTLPVPPGCSDKAKQRIIEFNISNECTNNLDHHIEVVASKVRREGQPDNGVNINDNSDRVKELAADYQGKWSKFGDDDDEQIADIDQKFDGGLTALMQATMEGNFEEVVRLVEAGAKTDLRDNAKMTAYERAVALGFTQIADLLEKYPR